MATIHTAAQNGNLNRVKALLNQGVPVNSRNEHGYTPLHEAASSGRLSVVQELLKRGAHVNPRTVNNGWTPLYLAAVWRHPHVIHALIKAGANPRYANIFGKSAYNLASKPNMSRNAIRTSRAATKWTKKTQNAANKRRQNAMRQVLGSVPVREGGSTRIGLPNNILRLIGSKIRRN